MEKPLKSAGENNIGKTDEVEEFPAYLAELEKAKELYEEYLRINSIFNLPIFSEEPESQHLPPSPEHPLTTDSFSIEN